MEITVRFLASVKNATGTTQTNIDVRGNTVGDVVDALIKRYGDKFRSEIMDSEGKFKQSIKVVLNKSIIQSAEPLKHTIREGDVLDILPPFYGG